ncbi:MAG TPA: ABC transporter substrate-binding protein [Verrucomicrobiae bacterium]|jgi:NitT/TauT family transport system substrate-binding protein|nr:ABC transporter substrate-binding protein [Verrucomicrobiae bacterium]
MLSAVMRSIAAVFIALLCAAQTVNAQTKPAVEKMRFIYSAIGGSQSSVWIPHEAGIFKKHGLDLELLYVSGGGRAAQVLLSGDAPMGIFTGAAVVSADLAGADLVVIASSLNAITFFLIARPEVRSIEALKGKKVGITRFGSATDFALEYSERRWPVKRGRDFAVIQMGGFPEMMQALKSGAIDAATLNAEFTILARKEGLKELVDMSTLGLSFPTSAIVTTRAYIKRSENTVRKFIRGFVEGSRFGKTNRGPSVEILRKYIHNDDREYLNALYDLYVLRYIPKVPYPSAEAIQTVLDQMADKDPRAAAARPEQFIDPRFFQELEREGFIQKLWP